MKRILCLGAALLALHTALCAQETYSHKGRLYIAVEGAPVLNLYENAFSFRENGVDLKLFTLQGAAALGYDFSDTFGLRLNGAYGKDVSACNVRQTSGGGFYPYSFKHANAFLDAVLNLNGLAGKVGAFKPKLYAGLGGAHTFGFTDAGHPWQKPVTRNTVFGFRGGFIAEYCFKSGISLYADLRGESYADM